jgi:hypothetical protein
LGNIYPLDLTTLALIHHTATYNSVVKLSAGVKALSIETKASKTAVDVSIRSENGRVQQTLLDAAICITFIASPRPSSKRFVQDGNFIR